MKFSVICIIFTILIPKLNVNCSILSNKIENSKTENNKHVFSFMNSGQNWYSKKKEIMKSFSKSIIDYLLYKTPLTITKMKTTDSIKHNSNTPFRWG